jgi:aspartyl-tRNA(Asn)/glutamyl-tRNA(Gln) amidotransferase subunit B
MANWLVNLDIPLMKLGETTVSINRQRLYSEVATLVEEGKLSSTNAKALLTELLQRSDLPADIANEATEKGYIQESDEGAIAAIVAQVITANQKAADDVAQGEMKAIGFLVGQVMKQSQGKANPALAQQLIKKQLGL